MKKLFAYFTLLVFIGCHEPGKYDIQKLPTYPIATISNGDADIPIFIIEIDHCEYIGYNLGGSSGYLTHKGNCKFCTARNASK